MHNRKIKHFIFIIPQAPEPEVEEIESDSDKEDDRGLLDRLPTTVLERKILTQDDFDNYDSDEEWENKEVERMHMRSDTEDDEDEEEDKEGERDEHEDDVNNKKKDEYQAFMEEAFGAESDGDDLDDNFLANLTRK